MDHRVPACSQVGHTHMTKRRHTQATCPKEILCMLACAQLFGIRPNCQSGFTNRRRARSTGCLGPPLSSDAATSNWRRRKRPDTVHFWPGHPMAAAHAEPKPSPSRNLGLIVNLVLPHPDADTLIALSKTHVVLESLALQHGGALWRRAATTILPSALMPPRQAAKARGDATAGALRLDDATHVRDVLAHCMQAQGNLVQWHIVRTSSVVCLQPVRHVL